MNESIESILLRMEDGIDRAQSVKQQFMNFQTSHDLAYGKADMLQYFFDIEDDIRDYMTFIKRLFQSYIDAQDVIIELNDKLSLMDFKLKSTDDAMFSLRANIKELVDQLQLLEDKQLNSEGYIRELEGNLEQAEGKLREKNEEIGQLQTNAIRRGVSVDYVDSYSHVPEYSHFRSHSVSNYFPNKSGVHWDDYGGGQEIYHNKAEAYREVNSVIGVGNANNAVNNVGNNVKTSSGDIQGGVAVEVKNEKEMLNEILDRNLFGKTYQLSVKNISSTNTGGFNNEGGNKFEINNEFKQIDNKDSSHSIVAKLADSNKYISNALNNLVNTQKVSNSQINNNNPSSNPSNKQVNNPSSIPSNKQVDNVFAIIDQLIASGKSATINPTTSNKEAADAYKNFIKNASNQVVTSNPPGQTSNNQSSKQVSAFNPPVKSSNKVLTVPENPIRNPSNKQVGGTNYTLNNNSSTGNQLVTISQSGVSSTNLNYDIEKQPSEKQLLREDSRAMIKKALDFNTPEVITSGRDIQGAEVLLPQENISEGSTRKIKAQRVSDLIIKIETNPAVSTIIKRLYGEDILSQLMSPDSENLLNEVEETALGIEVLIDNEQTTEKIEEVPEEDEIAGVVSINHSKKSILNKSKSINNSQLNRTQTPANDFEFNNTFENSLRRDNGMMSSPIQTQAFKRSTPYGTYFDPGVMKGGRSVLEFQEAGRNKSKSKLNNQTYANPTMSALNRSKVKYNFIDNSLQ
jgi:hypothetical protein